MTGNDDAAAVPPLAFGWTILHVPDVARAAAFYERAFGLERRFADPSGEYAELATGATTLAFAAHALIARLTGEPSAGEGGPPRGAEIAFTAPPTASRPPGPAPWPRVPCR